ncbi:dexamethasone-induced Ras-related protein 1-like [Diadema setosum]|uniref:dexamethasone-induced Ras-related protein 1-like n=1 Tax=Diadema antillarum TaxID=105358 RepID=UPI003A86D38A
MTSKASTPDSEISAPEENCYRLVVLGSPKVGKTAIVSRFLTGKFDDSYTPTIEDFHRKIYKIKGQVYQLDILDTSGNNPFPAIHKLSILTGDVFIIVYSIDDRTSFQEAVRLRDQIQLTKNTANGMKCPPMVIAGNKCDKDGGRQVPLEEAKGTFDQTRRCTFLETSAKKFYNVDVLFRSLFENARLPSEMSPSLHRKVSASHGPTSLRPSSNGKLALRRRLSEACGMVAPNARRPSVRSDLLQLRIKTLRGSSMDEEDDDESERGSIHRKLRKAMCCIQ